jgi:signal transduction histidine kinase
MPVEARERLLKLSEGARDAARRARSLSHLLTTPDLQHASFPDLLESQVRHFEQSMGICCELAMDEAFPPLSPEFASHLIYIIREAIHNAAKHGQAKHIWIDCMRQEGRAFVSISNDGTLLPPIDTIVAGIGLQQMRLRADLMESTFSIQPGRSGGTNIELSFHIATEETSPTKA